MESAGGVKNVILKKKDRGSVRHLHPWIFKSDIASVDEGFIPGDIVCVRSSKKNPIGYGYINPSSEIVVRLLAKDDVPIDTPFFIDRVRRAFEYRLGHLRNTDAFRVVHSEADLLPGLIVDKYGDTAVVQFLTLGMDVRRDMVVAAIREVMGSKCVYERSDVPVRKHEALQLRKGWILGEGSTRVQISENGVRFIVDIENGHKTGYYLDQRDNRKLIAEYVKGKSVLDCFSYTGSFAVVAAAAGAAKVEGIDMSQEAVALAGENAALNNCSGICSFRTGNVFDELKKYDQERRQYDVILLDPPTFTKSKSSVDDAYRGYKEINLRAMRLLRDGGYLLSSTCSHHVSDEMFRGMLADAANDTRRNFRVIARGMQACDHPVVMAIPESEYLKAYLVEACG